MDSSVAVTELPPSEWPFIRPPSDAELLQSTMHQAVQVALGGRRDSCRGFVRTYIGAKPLLFMTVVIATINSVAYVALGIGWGANMLLSGRCHKLPERVHKQLTSALVCSGIALTAFLLIITSTIAPDTMTLLHFPKDGEEAKQ